MLKEVVAKATERAHAAGAVFVLETACELVAAQPPLEHAPPFVFRTLLQSQQQQCNSKPTQAAAPDFGNAQAPSPFLRPDRLLTVEAPLREGHAAHNLLLNKFPVVRSHLLLCTAAFESQADDLTLRDMCALEYCARNAYDCGALCFYNCGAASGASQGHKHMQLIPAAPDYGPGPFFLEGVARSAPESATSLEQLGFRNAFCKLGAGSSSSWYDVYRALLARAGVGGRCGSYSFLCTPDWMIVIPRRCESCSLPGGLSASINAMGFAGSVLVADAEMLAVAKTIGPLAILRSCAFP